MEQHVSYICAESIKPLKFVFVACDCHKTGSTSKKCDEFGGYCSCKTHVVGRQCDKCEPGTYGFGPEGCKRKNIVATFF